MIQAKVGSMSDREYEPNPEDERIELLDDDFEPEAPADA